jgi:hypothetical protein
MEIKYHLPEETEERHNIKYKYLQDCLINQSMCNTLIS